MHPKDQNRYYVCVAFRAGHGESFRTPEAALAYAECEMERLVAEHEALELEDFEGIFCEVLDAEETWRFDDSNGAKRWVECDE